MKAALEQAVAMLREVQGQPRFLFAVDDEVRVGVGIHRRLEETGREQLHLIGHAAAQLPKDATVMGGFAFDLDQAGQGPWASFPTSLFVVPALEWTWRGTDWTEHRNGANAGLEDRVVAAAGRIRVAADWSAQVETALASIRAGSLSKVVLARCENRAPLSEPLDAFARLADAEPDAHAYYFEARPGHAFFGATPERLVRLRRGRLETHAVAGTAPRGAAATDAALGKRLLMSGKESHEHRLVVQHILERLGALGLTAEQGMRRLRKMANVQHLETEISATASAGLHVLDVAQALHPTPAVCGTPVEAAKAAILQLEGTPRGWYSGGVGWFNHKGEGDILVALRCALASPAGTLLYAGAGITEGSDPDAEFQETEEKLRGLEAVLP